MQSSSAFAYRQRNEMLRTITTLDDLNKELLKLGFSISRSATYLRFYHNDSIEGKRHVKTVPVKLPRPENTVRRVNTDRMYAKCSADYLQRFCSLFGPDAVLFLSTDDKGPLVFQLPTSKLLS